MVTKRGRFMRLKLALAVLLLASTSVYAANTFGYDEDVKTPLYKSNPTLENGYNLNKNPLKDSIITVPAGEIFRAVVTTPLSSANLTLGQNITFVLATDFYYNGGLVAPAGSSVNGTVLDVAKAKHGSLNGKLLVRFTQIVTPYGIQIPISAVIKTQDNSGVIIGGTKEDITGGYIQDLAVTAGSGAMNNGVLTTLSASDLYKGGTLANGVGSGGGLLKSIWDKGYDVEISVDTSVELMLTQPITISSLLNKTNY